MGTGRGSRSGSSSDSPPPPATTDPDKSGNKEEEREEGEEEESADNSSHPSGCVTTNVTPVATVVNVAGSLSSSSWTDRVAPHSRTRRLPEETVPQFGLSDDLTSPAGQSSQSGSPLRSSHSQLGSDVDADNRSSEGTSHRSWESDRRESRSFQESGVVVGGRSQGGIRIHVVDPSQEPNSLPVHHQSSSVGVGELSEPILSRDIDPDSSDEESSLAISSLTPPHERSPEPSGSSSGNSGARVSELVPHSPPPPPPAFSKAGGKGEEERRRRSPPRGGGGGSRLLEHGSLVQEEKLVAATLASLEQAGGDPSHIIKQDLRLIIQSRRKAQGKEELQVDFKTPPKEELTADEWQKALKRRDQNRRAAQRFRSKQRRMSSTLADKVKQQEAEHKALLSEFRALEREKRALLRVVYQHSRVCKDFDFKLKLQQALGYRIITTDPRKWPA